MTIYAHREAGRTELRTRDVSQQGTALAPDFFGQWERPWEDATTPRTEHPVRFWLARALSALLAGDDAGPAHAIPVQDEAFADGAGYLPEGITQ